MEARILVGWRRAFSGPDVAMVSPGGPTLGLIRVRQRLAPLAPVRAIFEPLLAAMPGARVTGPEGLVTSEGEHGAVMNAQAELVQRTWAVIYGDTHYALIEGHAGAPDLFAPVRAAVQKLAYSHCLGLGSDRWRRFYYEPPRSWSALVRPFATMWYAPSCPRQHQTITVFDARPPRSGRATMVRQQLFEGLSAEFGATPPSAPTYERTRDGLAAQLVTYTGTPPHRPGPVNVVNAVVRDTRYLYPFRLECDSDLLPSAEKIFHALVTSMRPIPGRASESGVLGSGWAE